MIIQNSKGEKGYIAIVTLAILFLLVGTGLAYLKWSADESVEFKRQYAATQAYYIAQSAVSQIILPDLMKIVGVPPTAIHWDGNTEMIDFDISVGMEGAYVADAVLSTQNSSQSGYGGAFNGITQFYNVQVKATVNYSPFNRLDGKEIITVDSTIFFMYHSSSSWAQYLYFTDNELTKFGEPIKFFNGDTLWWDVYSNDQIAIMQSPVFYGKVYTVAEDFWQGSGYNPQFLGGDPIFKADTIPFYDTLEDLRNAASAQGLFFSYPGMQYRCTFLGNQGFKISAWPLGLPFMDTVVYSSGPPSDGAVFVDGRLEVTGVLVDLAGGHEDKGVAGRMSVGSSEDMWLIDNIRYVDSDRNTGAIDSSTAHMLGLQSEGYVLIKNNYENGRDNGGNLYPNDVWRSSIIINAGVVALGESFSFEDQNDIIEVQNVYPGIEEWYISEGTSPDERGQIHLWGQVSQYRRGYVHRSNHGGTGYLKDYHYDYRFYFDPPPYYPRIDGQVGETTSIEGWGAGPIPEEPIINP